jgi:hypothetical protein
MSKSDTPCNVTYVPTIFKFPTRDSKETEFRRTLERIVSFEMLTPTHSAVGDERKRDVFDPQNLPRLGEYRDGIMLWRKRHPKYSGGITTTGRHLSSMAFHHNKIRPDDVEAIWNVMTELAALLQPVFGTMHFAWKDEDYKGYDWLYRGEGVRMFDYYEAGPPGVSARTWFGAQLGEMIGELLLEEAGAVRQPWGGWELVLLEMPWEQPFDAILERHRVVDEIVRRSGVFGDHSSLMPRPGPNWKPIPRNI